MGATGSIVAVKQLDGAMNLARSSYWLSRIQSGVEFERFVGALIGQASNTGTCVLNGVSKGGRLLGSAVPDLFFRGGILEAKLTGSAVTKNQLQQFAKYLQDDGNMTYVFMRRPTPDVVRSMQRWIEEAGFKVNLQIAYIFE